MPLLLFLDTQIGTASEHHVLYQYSLVGASNHYLGLAQTESVRPSAHFPNVVLTNIRTTTQPYFQPSPAPPSPFTSLSSFNDPTFPNGLNQAWALHVQSSSNILVFGAGFYSFFQSYDQACDNTENCQSQIVDVEGGGVAIYSLNTVFVTGQVSVGGAPVVMASGNRNGLSSTVTVWTS